MKDPFLLAVAALILVGTGQLAVSIEIVLRYAMPGAPPSFRVVRILPLIISSLCCFSLAWVALSGQTEFAGISTLALLAVFFICDGLAYWILVAYAVYQWWYRDRYEREG